MVNMPRLSIVETQLIPIIVSIGISSMRKKTCLNRGLENKFVMTYHVLKIIKQNAEVNREEKQSDTSQILKDTTKKVIHHIEIMYLKNNVA
ncbi:hypothetical protein CKF58_05965 [Psittacicella hinzii]|uniref:Uncharacterized protein n=1 Tax=Psittacicella hinzii TaxID=2028575 RepID=A0A3A1YGL6_9GAMM|nr:hypothetical protein CKF58_05965 [Psittacicella hinzii]